MPHGRRYSAAGHDANRVVGGSVLAYRGHVQDYNGYGSNQYDHLGGQFLLQGQLNLGYDNHQSPYIGHDRYYRSYYSPVLYPAFYRDPIYAQSYGHDDYEYPDTYNSNTTIYIGNAAGPYQQEYDNHAENATTVIVDPALSGSSTSPGSAGYERVSDAPLDGRQIDGSLVESSYQASIPPAATFIERGNQAFMAGRYDQAQDLYLQAVLVDARDSYAKLFLGLASFARGDFEMAALSFRQAMLLTDELLTQPIDLRQFYTEPTDLKGQLNRLERLVIREPANRDAKFLLGFIYFSVGQSEKALTVLITLTDIYPTDELAASLRNSVDRIVASTNAKTNPDDGDYHP